jgi:DNA sulfur modification protein DndD
VIIEELVLHDFGIYQGRHEINLTPHSDKRPIVLIGAMNGRGKTTMLDAINLVLFGKRARLSNKKDSWDTYLIKSINRKSMGGALVGMRFTIEDDLETRTYEISRSWEKHGKSIREYFDVRVNGEIDRILAEDWDEHIEGLLPLEVASLNFFDGEKIVKLADPVQSKNVIGAAIQGLLGLGVLERLESDLKVLLRRKQDDVIGDEVSTELAGLEAEIEALLLRRAEVTSDMATIKSQLDRNQELLRRLEDQARAFGADKWEQRAELESKVRLYGAERASIEGELHALAEGVAPIGLVKDLMGRTMNQMRNDDEVKTSMLLVQKLLERDEEILGQVSEGTASELRVLLERDRQHRKETAEQALVVHDDADRVSTLLDAALRDLDDMSRIQTLLDELDVLDSRLTDTERKLESVPTGEQLAPVLEELGRVRSVIEGQSQSHSDSTAEIDHINGTIERLQSKLERVRTAEADKHKGALEDQRIREYAQRAIKNVAELADITIGRNLESFETAIFNRFQQLIGKTGLISRVRIDRSTFEMTVETGEGETLPVERLSSGERQLLATATLWGMSTIAGRTIPLVVDTPLARLDKDHRRNLAKSYFPNAAQQVIILSTDSEFTDELYSDIESAISRQYLIEFRDEIGGSEIREGYFAGVGNDN